MPVIGNRCYWKSAFFSLSIGTCDVSRRSHLFRLSSAASFQVVPFLPTSSSCGGCSYVASRLVHQCAGLRLHFSSCCLLGIVREWEKPKERCDDPHPTGCREETAAAVSEPGTLPLRFLLTSPSTVVSCPTFLIFLGPVLIFMIPCWVLFKMCCNPAIGSVWSSGYWPSCGMVAALQGKVQPGHCRSRWTTAVAFGISTEPSHPRWMLGWAKGWWEYMVGGMWGEGRTSGDPQQSHPRRVGVDSFHTPGGCSSVPLIFLVRRNCIEWKSLRGKAACCPGRITFESALLIWNHSWNMTCIYFFFSSFYIPKNHSDFVSCLKAAVLQTSPAAVTKRVSYSC